MFAVFVYSLIGALILNGNSADSTQSVRHGMSLRQSINDMDVAASGYIYRQDGSGPASVVYLQHQPTHAYSGSDGSGFVQYPITTQYRPAPYSSPSASPKVKPFQTVHHYQQQPFLYHSQPLVVAPQPYKAPSLHPVVFHSPTPTKPILTNQKAPITKVEEENEDEGEDEEDDTAAGSHHAFITHANLGQHHKHHHGGQDGDHYQKQGGQKHGEEHHLKHGHKGNKAYNKEHAYSNGDKGSHDIQHHEGHYENEGGHKKSEYDEEASHGAHEKGEKGSKGGKFGEKKHHKKGSKTTGYHNVFHKDEYKKDHTFYDEADHRGHFDKHGGEHQFHERDEGVNKKGGHHESGQHKEDYGKKGHTDKGHFDKADEGHKKQHGNEEYHADAQSHGQKGGKQLGSEHKFAQHH